MSGAKLPEGSFWRIELPGGGYMTRAHYEQIPFEPLVNYGPGSEDNPTILGYLAAEDRRLDVVLFIDSDGELCRCKFADIDGQLQTLEGIKGAPAEGAPAEEVDAFWAQCEAKLVGELGREVCRYSQIYLD